jgi:hypothetical protein
MAKYDVFISYSRKDRAFTRRLADSLRVEGVEVVLVDDLRKPGDNWSDILAQRIKDSSCVVSVVDPKEKTQPSLYFEAGAAIGMGKKVTFIVPPKRSAVPSDLRGSLTLKRMTPERTAKEIVNSLNLGRRV